MKNGNGQHKAVCKKRNQKNSKENHHEAEF